MAGVVARLDTDTRAVIDTALLDELLRARAEIKRLEERVSGLLDANNQLVNEKRALSRALAELAP